MSKKALSRAFMIVAGTIIIMAATMIIINSPTRAAVPSDQEKTVEQVKQNIQVLKGMPESQLSPVMNYIASSLGVQCNHCHVIDSTGWYMDKDDKKTKGTARRMMQMVMDLNRNSFGGRTAVSCYTCHRGSTEPVKLISLPPPAANPEREATELNASLLSPEQVLASYETALGGADAMKKITSRVTKGVSVDMQGREIPLEIVQEQSGKYLSAMTMREDMMSTRAFDGKTGWMSSPRGTRELPPKMSEEIKKEASLFPLAELRGLFNTLHTQETTSIENTKTNVLASSVSAHETAHYYFDASSGLLLRKVVITETMVGNIPEQTDYSDYRTVDGVKVPFMVKNASVDSRGNFTHKFSSIEQNVAVDEKRFEMPPAKK